MQTKLRSKKKDHVDFFRLANIVTSTERRKFNAWIPRPVWRYLRWLSYETRQPMGKLLEEAFEKYFYPKYGEIKDENFELRRGRPLKMD